MDRITRVLGRLELFPVGGVVAGTVPRTVGEATGLQGLLAAGQAQQGGAKVKVVTWVKSPYVCRCHAVTGMRGWPQVNTVFFLNTGELTGACAVLQGLTCRKCVP